MTGYDNFNVTAFINAKGFLQALGFEVWSPSDIEQTDTRPWESYLREDIMMMMQCDGVCVLDKWWESRGARIEVNLASAIGMPVKSQTDWSVGR
jgi:hypothetical protein